MATDRNHLRELVDALSDREVPLAISFLSDLADEEVVDAETAAKLDRARAELEEPLSLEEVRKQLRSRPMSFASDLYQRNI
jgi:hypothetical protein